MSVNKIVAIPRRKINAGGQRARMYASRISWILIWEEAKMGNGNWFCFCSLFWERQEKKGMLLAREAHSWFRSANSSVFCSRTSLEFQFILGLKELWSPPRSRKRSFFGKWIKQVEVHCRGIYSRSWAGRVAHGMHDIIINIIKQYNLIGMILYNGNDIVQLFKKQ